MSESSDVEEYGSWAAPYYSSVASDVSDKTPSESSFVAPPTGVLVYKPQPGTESASAKATSGILPALTHKESDALLPEKEAPPKEKKAYKEGGCCACCSIM